jgi:hypothetical protein
LNSSTRVKEQANAQYEALSASCQQVDISVCKNQLKQSICMLIGFEIKVNKTAMATLLCKAIGSLAIACDISSTSIETTLRMTSFFTRLRRTMKPF